MENVMVADAFMVQEKPAANKPLFIVRKKVLINILKTVLFLVGITAMIINQARKDKIAQGRMPKDSVNGAIVTEQAALLPFSFLK